MLSIIKKCLVGKFNKHKKHVYFTKYVDNKNILLIAEIIPERMAKNIIQNN